MKYFSLKQINESLAKLKQFNAFFGITFLAGKQANLPIGKAIDFRMDAENGRFLHNYYRLNPTSEWFFRACRQSDLQKSWVKPNYASTGLQAINTQTFGPAFIHIKNSSSWGWKPDYIEVLKSKLPSGRKLPAFHLAVWLYREMPWKETTNKSEVVKYFTDKFRISSQETKGIFSTDVDSDLADSETFASVPVRWQQIQAGFERAPDAKPERGGALVFLETAGIGPAASMNISFGDRLTIITGDNGLGKSFLLEVAWFALSGDWADSNSKALPTNFASPKQPFIKFELSGDFGSKPQMVKYLKQPMDWEKPKTADAIPGLLIYARVDGSFAVWDPATVGGASASKNTQLVFSREKIWDGEPGKIEGLIRDWTKWQAKPNLYPFDIFRRVLATISPPDLGELRPGEPTRLPDDPREIPTIIHPYGQVPIKHESAGVRRIITLAYLMVWAWNEHKVHCEMMGRSIDTKMVVIIDEIEAHLHPKWQRVIMPALLQVAKELDNSLDLQLIVVTHSPLVLASGETFFDSGKDKLFCLDLSASGEVGLKELPFIEYGHVDSWLTSPIFKLSQPTSKEAEQVINEAIRLQKEANPSKDAVATVTQKLAKVLPPEDKFWARWIFFADRFGIEI